MLKFFYTDAGKSLYQPNEYADCAVRAYSLACGVDYRIAHSRLALLGRHFANTFNTFRVIDYLTTDRFYFKITVFDVAYARRSGGFGLDDLDGQSSPTVQEFVETHKRGRYLVRINGHIFCLRNGVIWDSESDTGYGLRQERISWVAEVKFI